MDKITGVSWKNSIFMRIIVTFVAILMPLYLLGIFIYDAALKSVHKEISSSMVSQVAFYMNGLEKEIERLYLLQCELISDPFLDRLSSIPEAMDNIEKVQYLLILQHRLGAIRSSSLYISDFKIYIPSIGRIVTDRSVEHLDMDNYLEIVSRYNSSELVSYIDGTPVILLESPYMDNNLGAPMYIMEIMLSKQAFQNALYQFDKYPGSGSFLMSTRADQYITSVNMKKTDEDIIISNIQGSGQGILDLKNSGYIAKGICAYAASEKLGMTLAIYVPGEVVFQPIKQYKNWFFIFTLAAAFVIALFSLSIFRFIHKPLMQLVKAFKQVEDGDLQMTIEHHYRDEFRYLYGHFNGMVKKLGNLIEQVYTMKILSQKAELKQLQSQINPHFLYNSFFILHRRIKGGDYENAITFSQQLGNYFRFITRSAEDNVPLIREVEHARIYSDIQRMRFSSRISVDFGELPEKYQQLSVPRLMLQPIIENAFEHGLENKASGGMLHIGFEDDGSTLTVIVEDNGESLSDMELTHLQNILTGINEPIESTGIINIHKRMQLKFGQTSGVVVMRSKFGGLRVEIRIRPSEEDEHV